MTLKIIKNFVHRPGVHCESTALRDIFEFHGFNFSEPMIFGLGSGIGFVYWKMKFIPFPFVGGRGVKDLGESFGENMGVARKVNKTSSRKKAYNALRDMIERDIPVMINVDMPPLKYWNLPETAHFGGHAVIVAGIDEGEGICYIADTSFENLQVATLKELEEARASRFQPFPPHNKWYSFEFPEKLTPVDEAIRNAICKTVKIMLNPPIKNFGIKGIKLLADEIVKWPNEYPSNKFSQYYEVCYIMLEEDGTGGGAFRYLYAGFLKETGEILQQKDLIELGNRYFKIGEKWTRVARLIKEMPSRKENSNEARKLLLDIANDEENIFNTLRMKFL